MSDTNRELKPCPFCGGEAEFWEWKRAKTIMIGCLTDKCITKKLRSKYLVRCANKKACVCKPQTKLYYTKAKATNVWNRRANDGT